MLIYCLGKLAIYLIELAQIYCLEVYDDRDTVVIWSYRILHSDGLSFKMFFNNCKCCKEVLSALTCSGVCSNGECGKNWSLQWHDFILGFFGRN